VKRTLWPETEPLFLFINQRPSSWFYFIFIFILFYYHFP